MNKRVKSKKITAAPTTEVQQLVEQITKLKQIILHQLKLIDELRSGTRE